MLLICQVFATGVVTSVGQAIGLVCADSQALAERAADLVEIEYDELPSAITIEDCRARILFHKDLGSFLTKISDLFPQRSREQ